MIVIGQGIRLWLTHHVELKAESTEQNRTEHISNDQQKKVKYLTSQQQEYKAQPQKKKKKSR